MFCLWLIASITFGQSGVSAIVVGLLFGGVIGAWFGFAHGTRQAEKLRAGKERNREAHAEERYNELVALKGCGAATAERIVEKILSGKPLTDREQGFWDQI